MSAETTPPTISEPPGHRKPRPSVGSKVGPGVVQPHPWDVRPLSRSERYFRQTIAKGLRLNAGLDGRHANALARQAVTLRRILEASRQLTPREMAGQLHVIAGVQADLVAIEERAFAKPAHRSHLAPIAPPSPPQPPAAP